MALDRALEPAVQAGPLTASKLIPPEREHEDLAALQARLGYTFRDPGLLARALTHIGAAGHRAETYQRLEFLGDRVLGVCVSAMLYAAYPEAEEGELSRRLADLVRRETCAAVATEWAVDAHIRLGPGEKTSASLKRALLGDLCESILGAVFLDGGLPAASTLVERGFAARMRAPSRALRDPKTMLQEWAQARALATPSYRELTRHGPDHAPEFTVAVSVERHASAEARGSSKRAAEQAAAAAFMAREGIAPAGGPS